MTAEHREQPSEAGHVPLGTELERHLTVREVSEITRLSRAKVYNLIAAGVLPSVQPPGCARKLVAPRDLKAYLQAGRKGAAR